MSVHKELKKKSYNSALVLQVHDEVILDVVPDELASVEKIVKKNMENAYEISVELKVDIAVGKSWAEAKS